MKILSIINNEFVEILWIDDSEIEIIPIQEFIDIHGAAKLKTFKKLDHDNRNQPSSN